MFTVLLNWTVVSWPQPVAVLQDLEPGLTDPLIFQKKPGCYTSVQGPLSCGKESSRVTRPRRRGREHRPPAGLPPPWPHHLHKGLEASQLARAERGCRSSGLQACVCAASARLQRPRLGTRLSGAPWKRCLQRGLPVAEPPVLLASVDRWVREKLRVLKRSFFLRNVTFLVRRRHNCGSDGHWW